MASNPSLSGPTPVTLCGTPSMSATWIGGTPTPIVWSCAQFTSIAWEDLKPVVDGDQGLGASTVPVWVPVDRPLPTAPGSDESAQLSPRAVSIPSELGHFFGPGFVPRDVPTPASPSPSPSASGSSKVPESSSESSALPTSSISRCSSPASRQSTPTVTSSYQSTATTDTTPTPSSISHSIVTAISIGSPSRTCTASDFAFETKISMPTGAFILRSDGTGWGTEGTIWNITTGDRGRLTNLQAKCHGSSCKGPSEDGTMVKRPDGSWYLNVTASMHPSINILGELVDDGSEQNKNRRRKFRRDAGYPLAVSGVPPCGLPIVQTCNASSKFKADGDQWKALHVDDFMESYIDKTGVKSFDEFRSQAMQDFDSNVDDQRCDITSEAFSCSAPLSSDCTKSTDNDHKRGMIMTTALARFTAFYRSLWKTVDDLAGELSLEIDSITSTLYKPNPAQKWGQVMSISAAAVGFITAAAIVAATFLPEVFGAILVAIPTIAAAGAGTGGAIGALKSQSETDALFKQSGDYKTDARNMIHDISNSLNGSYSADMGGSGLASIFKGGSWVNHEVTEIFNKQGAGAQATAWFEKFMVAQVVTNILKSNDIYILFVPYGDDVKYSDQKWGFQKSDCESAWNNNPKWMFYADCNMKGGPKGEPGMAVFVRPYSVGAETAEWIKPVSFGDHQQIIGADILSSSLSGQTNHGFNYTFLDQDIGDIVAKEGMAGAQRMFGDVNLRTPGLFTVPVCVTSDLVNIPGVGRVMMDKKNGHGDTSSEAHSTDPCSCKSYTETTSGEEQSFTDYVSDNIADSFGPSCKVSGHTDRWGMRL